MENRAGHHVQNVARFMRLARQKLSSAMKQATEARDYKMLERIVTLRDELDTAVSELELPEDESVRRSSKGKDPKP